MGSLHEAYSSKGLRTHENWSYDYVLADIAHVWQHERAGLIKHFEAGEKLSNFKSIVPLLQPDI